MNAKKTIIAVFAGTALLAAAGVQAQDRRWDNGHRDHGYRDHGYNHGHYRNHGPRVVVRPAYSYYAPRYVAPYYAPAPVYYPPAPVYYQPAPAIYGQIPLGHRSSIGFSLPLY